jgi:hypothetical protein
MLWETDGFGLAFATDARREGMAAFLEWRQPRFTGVEPVSGIPLPRPRSK